MLQKLISRVIKQSKIESYTIQSVDKCEYERNWIIDKAKLATVYKPAFFDGASEGEEIVNTEEINVIKYYDVKVCGGTNFILKRNIIYSDIFANDEDDRIRCNYLPIITRRKKKIYLITRWKVSQIERAINLCGLASANYYHLSIETLSRLAYIKGCSIDSSIPVLVDEVIEDNKNLLQLVNLAVGNHPIVYVKNGQKILCNELYFISMNTWMPFNLKKAYEFLIEDNAIAASAVLNLRGVMSEYLLPMGDRKVFISRKNAANKRIINEDEVADLFLRYGYDIVDVGDLDVIEQIYLFSSSKCIVGATGAALTNIIYCNPGTVFGCIIPDEYNFYIYSSLGHYVGCKELFFNPKVVQERKNSSDEKWIVDIELCEKYIHKLQELIEK